ncbi:phosphoenolpyruvate-utilizing N-terminal domain-containing protein [Ralstonia pseudosolanacearum]|uniref:TetR-like C-terminal domain-containing protein n=1 Tax=Ralstonia pseudosolanacearum TaxID=1310165 RepID=UPI003D16C2C7
MGASPGVAVGQIVRWSGIAPEFDETGGPFEQEHARLHAALQIAASQIKSLVTADTLPDTPQAQIMDAHLAFLEDPMLIEAAEAGLRSGASAAGAWHLACQSVEQHLRLHANPQVRERAALRAVGVGYLRFAQQETGLFRTAFAVPDEVEHDADPDKAGDSGLNPFQLLGAALDRMTAAGVLPAEHRPGAEYLAWSAVHGLALLIIDGPLRGRPPEQTGAIALRVVEMVENGL